MLMKGVLITSLAATSLAHPRRSFHNERQYGNPSGGGGNSNSTEAMRAQAVKDAFQFAWDGYFQYAFPNDELLPVTNSFSNSRNGFGASAFDALSTALVMGLPDIVTEIVNYIPSVNFRQPKTGDPVSLFETTIRYMGGMLAGYDLLTGPLSDLAEGIPPENVQALLSQSMNLADALKFAFDTPSGVPFNNLFPQNQSHDDSTTNGLATVGSLVLEWTHLSDLLGNDTEYASLAQKGESYLLNPSPPEDEPYPGLVGDSVYISNGSFANADTSWNGGSDSFYEYLLKMYVYDSSRFGSYKDRWTLAADSTIANLASHPSSRPDLTFLASSNGKTLDFESQHLTCFDGGNFILGGLVLDNQDYLNFGLDLVNGCHDTYISTATGIGPEVFSWNDTNIPANQTDFYEANGFWIEDSDYILRPEVIESFYYAYRATRDPMYQDWAWDAFQAIYNNTKANSGFSEISDVNAPGGGTKLNFQDSFLFAEVLKYSYLIHAPDAVYDVEGGDGGTNAFVFNTEAHPFKVAGTPIG
ncbi:MAG: hypothetical protein Q9227_004743 [Pyrenula ochraceoflavens]